MKGNFKTPVSEPWSSWKDKAHKKDVLKSGIRSSCRGVAETNPTKNHEAAGSIPGLTQWVKDLALLWAVVQVPDTARIWHCCGSGVGRQQQLRLDP